MGQFVFLMLASHEIFTLFLFNYESHGQEEASSTYFDFAFKALVLLQQLQCVISICISKSGFFKQISCAVFYFVEFVRFGDCPREDLAIFGYRLQKRVGKFRNPTIFLPQSRTCCLYTAISNFCPLMLFIATLGLFVQKKPLYLLLHWLFSWSPGCKTLIICKVFFLRFYI